MSVNNNCSSKQTFCTIIGQTVKQNNDITFHYNGCIAENEIIANETWNELISAIIKVYNFGNRGTRNPISPFSISPDTIVNESTDGNETAPTNRISEIAYQNKLQNNADIITITDYNEILSTIGATLLPSSYNEEPIIYGSYFKNVMDTLNNYKLNDTRCNNCNTGCNVLCQAHAQCCDSHCCTQCCTDCCTNCCTNCCTDYGEGCYQYPPYICGSWE